MFFIFTMACKKYKFSYTLSTNNGLTLRLHPNNFFGFIEIKQEYYDMNYFKLFFTAIKKMRRHRKGVFTNDLS